MSLQSDLRGLAQLSLTDPERGADWLMRSNPPVGLRWLMLALSVVLGVLLGYTLPILTAPEGMAPSPMRAVGVQFGLHVASVWMITMVGHRFGGRGSFQDALLLVAWLQLILVGFQAVQLVALLILPPLAFPVAVASVAAFLWMLTGFVRQLHGFASRGAVLVGILLGAIAMGFMLAMLMLMLGFDPAELMNA
jgi:hypothetical protein